MLVFVLRLIQGRTRLLGLPLDGPILAFAVWTFLSASFSSAPLESHEGTKQIVLFCLLYLAVDSLIDARHRERILDAALLGTFVLASGVLLQFYFLGYDTIDNRPHSFLGHYMTTSGLLMLALLLAAARLAFGPHHWVPSRPDVTRLLALVAGLAVLTALRASNVFAAESERLFVAGVALSAGYMAVSTGIWPGPATSTWIAGLVIPISVWALLLTQTRNAWLGAIVGLTLIAILRAPKLLWGLGAAILLVAITRPEVVMRRLTLTDASSRDRYFMWQAGVDMIMEKPIFGQGPRMVEEAYGSYRWPGAPNPNTSHLHNNVLQLAAERGIPCAVWWLWWMAAAMGDAYRQARIGLRGLGWVSAATLAALSAVLVAGLAEYNFGDSEVLMFILLLTALPYALKRQRLTTA